MAVTTADSGAGRDALVESLRRKFIPFLRNELRFADFTTPGSLQVHGGSKTLRWRVFNKITQDETGGLTEADATDGEVSALSVTTVTTTCAEYGAWAKIGSLADIASSREDRQEYAEAFGEHGARTIDTLLRNAAMATTTFLVSTETEVSSGTLLTAETAMAQDIAVISGAFNQNDCKSFQQNGGYYVVIVHGEVEQDLVTDVTTTRLSWSEVNKNVPGMDGQKKMIVGTPGAIYGTMVLRSNNITTATLTNNTVGYANVALSRNAVGKAGFGAMTPRGGIPGSKGPQIITKNSGPNDTSNPLSMFGTIGWKATCGQALIENVRAIVYYSAQ